MALQPNLLFLDDPRAQHPAVAGSKAATLARLRHSGFPVPAGFAVTAPVFASAIQAVRGEIAGILGAIDPSQPLTIESAAARAQAVIMERGLPPALEEALGPALRAMGTHTVAVRSSATTEDLPSASFAGQYDSFLNVPAGQTADSVLRVWASFYSARALAYRVHQGLRLDQGDMAVLVLEMIPAEAAGVLFTQDAAGGSAQHMIVSAALGLGEGVVTGRTETDRYWLDRDTGTTTRREIADKRMMIVANPSGGTTEVEVDPARRKAPIFHDDHLAQFWQTARGIQELLGGEQDIEFASTGGRVAILQARPLTALPDPFPVPWPAPEDATRTWTLMRSRPLRRLHEDIVRTYYTAKRRTYEQTGAPYIKHSVLLVVNGYPYARVPDVNEQEMESLFEAHQARVQRLWDERQTTPYELEIVDQVKGVYRGLRDGRPKRPTLEGLVAYVERTVDAYAFIMWDLHWRDVVLDWDWPATYEEITGRPREEAVRLTQGIPSQTTRMFRAMRAMARLVQSSDLLTTIFQAKAYARLDDPALRKDATVVRLRGRLRRLLRRYGRRTGAGFGSRGDVTDPTWGMRPAVVLDLIGAFASSGVEILERREAAVRRERQRITRAVRRLLAADPPRRARFEDRLQAAQRDVLLFEDHNHLIDQESFGLMREAIWQLGKALATDEAIATIDDVFHLSLDELRAMARGERRDWQQVIDVRRDEYERRCRMKPPRTLGAPPAPDDDEEPPAGRQGDRLIGRPASPGRATGPARVLLDVTNISDVRSGEILVTANAGPDLTPWFPILAGLVLDAGAVEQHAGIIAREYGIPAVFGTKEATSAIATGQTITVDGSLGIVGLTPQAFPLGATGG